jgi:glycosyltransferase involved in cell wall biosynthesis
VRLALIVPGFSRDAGDWAIPALQTLACSLARRLDVELFSLRYPPAGTYHVCNLRHHATGGGTRGGLPSLPIWRDTVRSIITRHRRQPFDLLHAFWLDEPAFVAALAGALLRLPVLASSGGGELVYFPDLDYGTQGSAWRRLLIRFALRRATLVTAGSHFQKALCRRAGVPESKLRLAPLGVDTERFRPAPNRQRGKTIVQAASLTPVKQQGLLLESAARARATLPDLEVVIAGEGPEGERLRQQAAALGLAPHARWLGARPHLEMPAIYQQAQLYVQTSRHESQGMAVVEALACGLPALGTPVGLLPEVAALPAALEAESLAAQIVNLLDDDAAWLRRAEEARALAESGYSLPVTMGRFLELFDEMTQIREGPRSV